MMTLRNDSKKLEYIGVFVEKKNVVEHEKMCFS